MGEQRRSRRGTGWTWSWWRGPILLLGPGLRAKLAAWRELSMWRERRACALAVVAPTRAHPTIRGGGRGDRVVGR